MQASEPVCQDAFYLPCHSLWNTAPRHHNPVSLLGHRNKVLCAFTTTNSKTQRQERIAVRPWLICSHKQTVYLEVYSADFAQNVHKWCIVNSQMYDKQLVIERGWTERFEFWLGNNIAVQRQIVFPSQAVWFYEKKKTQNRMHDEQHNCATSADSSLTWGTQLLIKDQTHGVMIERRRLRMSHISITLITQSNTYLYHKVNVI